MKILIKYKYKTDCMYIAISTICISTKTRMIEHNKSVDI